MKINAVLLLFQSKEKRCIDERGQDKNC